MSKVCETVVNTVEWYAILGCMSKVCESVFNSHSDEDKDSVICEQAKVTTFSVEPICC